MIYEASQVKHLILSSKFTTFPEIFQISQVRLYNTFFQSVVLKAFLTDLLSLQGGPTLKSEAPE